MHRFLYASVVACSLLGVVSVRAAEQDDIKAILDKAIKAHGGEEKLSKSKAVTMKIKGKWYGMGEDGVEYNLETARTTTQFRFELTMDVGGQKFSILQVVNGNKGW